MRAGSHATREVQPVAADAATRDDYLNLGCHIAGEFVIIGEFVGEWRGCCGVVHAPDRARVAVCQRGDDRGVHDRRCVGVQLEKPGEVVREPVKHKVIVWANS